MNHLSPIEFDFTIKRLPNVSFAVQAVNLPGMNIGVTEQPTPFMTINRHGDKATFDELTITIILDENMESWKEIYEWMVGLTSTDTFDQHKTLKESEFGLYSDASLLVMSNSKNPNREFMFRDMFPISLGSIQMDTRAQDVDYATCDITFKFTKMDIDF